MTVTGPRQSTADTAAVLGSPIAHSKSPALHRAAYAALGLDWDYRAIDVNVPALAGFLDSAGSRWRGLSLTMPLKEAALDLVDVIDPIAALARAVNTVVFEWGASGSIRRGFNTDVTGIVDALADDGMTRVHRAAVIGAGATAASAVIALSRLGVDRVSVFARTPAKAALLGALAREVELDLVVSPIAELADVHGDAVELVVSTLPGLAGADLDVSSALRSSSRLLDVAYDPWPSPLATAWARAGGAVTSGLGMLLHQALVQVRLFTSGDAGRALPDEFHVLEAMRASVRTATGESSGDE